MMLHWLNILLIIASSHIAMGQELYNAVLSASPSGKYIIVGNLTKHTIGLIDLQERQELKDFIVPTLTKNASIDLHFVIWQGDTSFYYVDKSEDGQFEVCVYDIAKNTSKTLNTLSKSIFNRLEQVAYPAHITPSSQPFIICQNAIKEGTSTLYPDTTILYKFYPLTGKTERLLSIDRILGSDVIIESVAVNHTGTTLLISTESDDIVTLHKIDIKSQKATIIKASKQIERLYLFFMSNDNWFVYFKRLGKNTETTEKQIVLHNLRTEKTHNAGILGIGQTPVFIADVPFKSSMIISYLDLKEPIEMDEPKGKTPAAKIVKILENWVLGMLDRSHFTEISYKGIIPDNTASN